MKKWFLIFFFFFFFYYFFLFFFFSLDSLEERNLLYVAVTRAKNSLYIEDKLVSLWDKVGVSILDCFVGKVNFSSIYFFLFFFFFFKKTSNYLPILSYKWYVNFILYNIVVYTVIFCRKGNVNYIYIRLFSI